ncbi:malto-oligosyltrehalose synthase [Alcaligenaceae bacterium]|nr:malto-oligosyltrehalose synthase [Alcaligenaceae bacterium]
MSTPLSTVRLQLHGQFTLADAAARVPYFSRLGISHLYLSPITRARAGSTHGYDVVDHTVVSDELGGIAALRALVDVVRSHGMGLLLDIVPNHMATHSSNAWWWDVLRHGRLSRYADSFDIDWHTPQPGLRGKVLAPFLAKPYGESLADGSIAVVLEQTEGVPQIEASGARYPIAPDSMRVAGLDAQMAARYYDGSTEDGRQRLHELLEKQHYRLAWWRCAADMINWRRFFEVSELIGVRVELPEVFDAVHALPLQLYAEGLIDGLRIDHVDGLAQPVAYCAKLRAALDERRAQRPAALRGDAPWLIIEKILAPGETLDASWQVDGTSGYDFMDQAGAVLHQSDACMALTDLWARTAQDNRDAAAHVRAAKKLLLERHFAAERKALLRVLWGLAQGSVRGRDWSRELIGRVLDRFLEVFPVYRTYVGPQGRNPQDADLFARVMSEALAVLDRGDAQEGAALLTWLEAGLVGIGQTEAAQTAGSTLEKQGLAIRRFQQLTPPLAAKSLEDTTFYRYGRLLSRNEVGSDPAVFAIRPAHYHERNAWRAAHAPRALLATATHDHKRGEDARARLAVLTEAPDLWAQAVARWMQWPGTPAAACALHAGERYMLWQAIVGAWPMELRADDEPAVGGFIARLSAWQTKALREGKQSSGWFCPDEAHEADAQAFLDSMAVGGPHHALLKDIGDFVARIAPAGALNGLVQTVLRTTAPGIPDLYQGTEFWDFSLVDPDNRRPVDYPGRQDALDALDSGVDIIELLAQWRDGRIKQAVVAACLRLRRRLPLAFSIGAYEALPVSGKRHEQVLAYARSAGDQHCVVVLPLHGHRGLAAAGGAGSLQFPERYWEDTSVSLPPRYAGMEMKNALDGSIQRPGTGGMLRLDDLFADLPLAVLAA